MDYTEYTEPVTYIKIGESSVTKENLVAHLSNYERGDYFEPMTIGSLNDEIGKMLHQEGVVEPLEKSTGEPFSMRSERVGWKDSDGKAAELYKELTVEEKTYKVYIGGVLHSEHDFEEEAESEKIYREERNPDVNVRMEVETERVIE